MKNSGYILILAGILLIFLPGRIFAQNSSISSGLSYLYSIQSSDGHWGSADSTTVDIIASTETVVETLRLLESTPSSQQLLGRNFLSGQVLFETDYLARRILALAGTTSFITSDQTTLISLQNKVGGASFASDNGWGGLAGYGITTLDTSLTLQALAAVRYTGPTVITPSLGYLVNTQNPDGDWGFVSGNASQTYTTALALKALSGYASQYNLNASTQNAVNYLLSHQTAPGHWENTIYLTALTYIALHDLIPQEPMATDVKNFLTSRQLPNGSWGDDPYQTALAIRALFIAGTLPANPTLGIIRGKVIDSQTGQPLSGVAAGLTGLASKTLLTGADGGFEFRDLAPGAYTVALSLANYGPLQTNTQVAAGQTVDLGTQQMIKQQGAPTGTIRGVVTDAQTGAPIVGAAISVNGTGAGYTDNNGAYQVNNVPAGSFVVSVNQPGYAAASSLGTLQGGAVYLFSPALVEGSASSPMVIQGMVTSAVTGLPLQGVLIRVSGGTNAFTTTDAQGSYQMLLDGGIIDITATLAGYDTVAGQANLTYNRVVLFSPKLYPQGTTPAGENSAGVTGIVLEAGTGQPLANVTVVATYGSTSKTLNTGSDGRFTLRGITVSSVALDFTLSGYISSSTGTVLPPLETLDIGQIRMRKQKAVVLLPDLTIQSIDRSGLLTDARRLTVSGTLTATIANIGTAAAPSNIELLAFQDANLNGTYDPGIDVVLGRTTTSAEITVGGESPLSISIQGPVPFLDAPIYLRIDSAQSVIELKEDNNFASTADHCVAIPDIRTFKPVLKWAWTGSAVLPNHRQVMSIPIVAPLEDTNGDGKIDGKDIPAVIFNTFNGSFYDFDGVLRAVSGKDGHDLWTVTDPRYRTNGTGSIAVGDIDGDGRIDIIVPKNGGGLLAFNHDGTFKWSSTAPSPGWGGASLVDLDGDGRPEIIVGRTVLNGNGTVRWVGSGATGFSLSIAADLDLDGTLEVVAGATVYKNSGQILWRNEAVGEGFTAVGNFNDDPYPEIVVVVNSRVFLLSHTGAIIWGPVFVPGGGGGMPTIGDFDGDGRPDIGVAGGSRYVVLTTDGSLLWTAPTQDLSSMLTGSSAFDFDGDGKVEVLYADERFLHVYRGTDGALLFETPNTSGTTYELPVVADVDGDNHADIVLAINDYYLGGYGAGIRVYQDQNNSWVKTRRIWNQHAYHITNVNDDGTVPSQEQNSWEVNNSYRLNALINESPIAAPDLTASLLQVVDHGAGQPLSLRVRIGNGGAAASPDGVTVSFYEGDPAAGGTCSAQSRLQAFRRGHTKMWRSTGYRVSPA